MLVEERNSWNLIRKWKNEIQQRYKEKIKKIKKIMHEIKEFKRKRKLIKLKNLSS